MNVELTGRSIIGPDRGAEMEKTFQAFNPQTGETVGPQFYSATLDELNRAADLAEKARIPFGKTSGRERAGFLRVIAES